MKLTFFTFLFLTFSSFAQNYQLEPHWWSVNGDVYDVLVDTLEERVFLGGAFSSIGPVSSNLALINRFSSGHTFRFPSVNGEVRFAESDQNGGWYIGGLFNKVGDSIRNKFAHIDENGIVSSLNLNIVGDYIESIIFADSVLFVGGKFDSIQGQKRYNIAKFNLQNNQLSSWSPTFNSHSYSMELKNNLLYIGSKSYMSLNSYPLSYLISLNTISGQITTNFNVNGPVHSLKIQDDQLFFSGNFTHVLNQGRNRLASINLSNISLSNLNLNIDGVVRCFDLQDSVAYFSGEFSSVNGVSKDKIASVNIYSNSLLPFYLNVPILNSIVIKDSILYMGGNFNSIMFTNRNNLVSVNVNTMQLLEWEPFCEGVVNRVSIENNDLFVCGNFYNVGNIKASNLAVLDLNTGEPLSINFGTISGPVNSIKLHNGILYVGGNFSTINNTYFRQRLASFNAQTGQLTNWNPSANSNVSKLVINNQNELFISGFFTTVSGFNRAGLASFDLSTGSLSNWDPLQNTPYTQSFQVYDMVYRNEKLYVTGFLYHMYSLTGGLAVFDENDVLQDFDINMNGNFFDFDITDTVMYGVGNFSEINGLNQSYLAGINLNSGQLVPNNIDISGFSGSTAIATSLIANEQDIIFVGFYDSVNGHKRNFVSSIDKNTFQVRSWNIDFNDEVSKVFKTHNGFAVSGTFTEVDGKPISRLAFFSRVCENDQLNIQPSGEAVIQVSQNDICSGLDSVKLTVVSQNLNSANEWFWYTDSCGVVPFDSGFSIDVFPLESTHYFVKGQGSCVSDGICQSVYINVLQNSLYIDTQIACDSYTWMDGITYTESNDTAEFFLTNAQGCDSIIKLNLTLNNTLYSVDSIQTCTPITWIDGITYTESNTTATHTLQTVTGCDSVVSLHLTIVNPQPISANVYVQPSHPDSCVGNLALHVQGNELFEVYIDDILAESNVSDYSLFSDLCSGVHTLKITDVCGDSLVSSFVIPVDSNYIFTNPFLDSIAVDSLGTTVENCEIDYNSIDTAYIDSLWATGNTVYVIWNIVDANGSNYDTTSFELNNGNGVYYLQLSLFCPNRALGEYFTVSQAIHFSDGSPSIVSVDELEDAGVFIFPNPTSSSVTIQLSGQSAQVKLYDAHGKFIREQQIISSGELSLVDVQSGIYMIEIITDQNRSIHKVIKQ